MTNNTAFIDRIGRWLHWNAHATLRLRDVHIKLFHFGYHTEHGGGGRVLTLSIFGGAGYAPRPQTCTIRGFTIGLRLRAGDRPSSLVYLQGWQRFPFAYCTTNCAKYYF